MSRYLIIFEVGLSAVPAIIRLRRLLKFARALGLRCVSITEEKPQKRRISEKPHLASSDRGA